MKTSISTAVIAPKPLNSKRGERPTMSDSTTIAATP